MSVLRARIVAAPAASLLTGEHGLPNRAARRGKVLGAGSSALYVQAGEQVIAITARAVPLMPNGIAVDAIELPKTTPGMDVTLSGTEITSGETNIRLEGAGVWDPAAPDNPDRSAAEVGRRGRGVLRNCRVAPAADPERMAESLAAAGLESAADAGGRKGTAALLVAVAGADSSAAAEAGSLLLGRGSGLTPEGDDLIGGALAAVAAFGPASGLDAAARAELVDRLCPPDVRARTTLLSATLLELAARGMVVEPMLPVLNLNEPPDRWRPALRRLLAIGHTTGRAWALGSAAAAAMLGRKKGNE